MDQVVPYFLNPLSSQDDVGQQISSFCEIKSNISNDTGVAETSLENGDPDLLNNRCEKDSLKSEEKTEIPGCSTVSVTPDVESSNNTVETSENRDCKLTPFNREDSKEVQNNTVMKQPRENDNLETCSEENNWKITSRSNGIENGENNHNNMESLKKEDKKELAIIEEFEISQEDKSNVASSKTVSKTDQPKQEEDATWN